MSARSHEHERLAAASLCSRRDPIILEGLFELVLDIVRIVGELHERGVIAGAAATGEPRIILRLPRIVEELHEHGVIAGAAATGEPRIILRLPRIVDELLVIADAAAASEGGIVLPRIVGELLVIADAAAAGECRIVRPASEGGIVLPRIVGELLVIADAAAAGEGRIVLARIVGVRGDDAVKGLTFGYVELVARTYDDCPRAELTGSQIFDLNSGVAFSLSRYDLKRFCVDIDAVIVRDCQHGLLRVGGCKRYGADGGGHDDGCCIFTHGTELLCGGTTSTVSLSCRGHILSLALRER